MSIQSFFKSKNYVLSKRDYTSDYSRVKSQKIDMTLSGKYLSDYSHIFIDVNDFDKYPSHVDIIRLENEIKKKYKLKREIILGAGANGLLQNIVKVLFINRGNLVTPFYTFNQVEFAVTSFNGITRRVYTNGFKIDFKKMKKAVNRKTRMVYICNPNNPTGIYEKCEDIINFAKSIKVPVVVDESAMDFANNKSLLDYKELPNNILVVRSFSKGYGIANFRLGYLNCTALFKKIYSRSITTNEFSGISCIIAKDLLTNGKDKILENIKLINEEKSIMNQELLQLGIKCIPSSSNTIMTETIFKNDFLCLLEKNGISVVPIFDKNNKLHIRIAIQDKDTNNNFIKKMKKLVETYKREGL